MGVPLVGKTEFQNSNSKPVFIVDPDSAFVQLILQSATAQPFKILELTNTGSLSLMDERARLDGMLGWCLLGGKGKAGMLALRNGATQNVIVLDAGAGNLYLGGNGAKGDLFLFAASETDNSDGNKASVHLDGATGNVRLGGARPSVVVDAVNANIHVGGNSAKGDVLVYAAIVQDNTDGSKASIHLDGNESGRIAVRKLAFEGQPLQLIAKDTIVLDGKAGDIALINADCAEDFEVIDFDEATPGTVMSLDTGGRLRRSSKAYDKKVAGIVSGAGELKPGIVLGRDSGKARCRPIALAGRVNCKVDAQYASVETGDLLTTSGTPGHAMKVVDEAAAFGAVIGKALAPLVRGQDLLPVLVSLQ